MASIAKVGSALEVIARLEMAINGMSFLRGFIGLGSIIPSKLGESGIWSAAGG